MFSYIPGRDGWRPENVVGSEPVEVVAVEVPE
jgi:hypothetical protein